jgi:hypothetical protein
VAKNTKLFDPVVPSEKRHPNFERIRTKPASYSARAMMEELWRDFRDKDGHFVREFQTTGFDARVFELYLFAYFSRSGYAIDSTHSRPDFLVERDGVRVAIEATTSSRPGPFITEEPVELSDSEIARKQRDEIPVRLGSPLFSKLQKRYWELPQVAGLPFVIAIEAFHDTTALFFPSGVLANYLYGLEHFPTYTEDGELVIESLPIASHQRPGKTPIPSNFFAQPGAEHVSAILFSNSGTYSKFNRMGYQAGHQRGDVVMLRNGTCWNSDPNASEPLRFSYDVRTRPTIESWGEGLDVFHNPNALIPLPRKFFRNAADSVLTKTKTMDSLVPDFHPYFSITRCLHDASVPKSEVVDGIELELISEREFDELKPISDEEAAFLEHFAEEVEWWATADRRYIAPVLRHLADNDWNAVILARDSTEVFRAVDIYESLPDRARAREAALKGLAEHHKADSVALP